jgi:outer membrane receptor for ferric coprogen and ferric-rhodotorulic acid
MSRLHTQAIQPTLRPIAHAVRLACTALVIGNLAPIAAYAQESLASGEVTLPTVTVAGEAAPTTTEETGSYTASSTNTATRFDMSLRETPQSVSVVTRAQMNDFGYNDVNDALENTTGVTVEQVETDRTYYTARGFDITNFQVDGVGIPFTYGHSDGDIDTVIYDRIEVLRGATGLLSSLSNPSATINFIRKRPTADFQASASASVGSWDYRRVEGDVSGALTKQGSVRGRFVGAYQNQNSYLDRYELERSVFYGVVEADVADSTVLTLGHHQQNNNPNSPLWGALPIYDKSGNQLEYDVSASTAAKWAYWDRERTSTFVELAHYFNNGWQGKAILTQNKATENSKLFYLNGTPDPATAGSDLTRFSSRYDKNAEETLFDLYATGPFALFGRKHELMVGANWSDSTYDDISYFGDDFSEISLEQALNGSVPEPTFATVSTFGSNVEESQKSVYAAARLNLTDRLMVLGGARVTSVDVEGVSYGRKRTKSYDDKVTPYVGASYRLNDTYSAYASYTKLFQPQTEMDINGNRLDPITGKSYEAGVKAEFLEKKLNSTFAVFRTKQRNLAEIAGTVPTTYYTASDEISSSGYEIDVAGEVTNNLQLAAGYTYVSIEDSAGEPTRTYVPNRLFRVSTTYRMPTINQLKVGASINWQDDIYKNVGTATTGPNTGSPIIVRQESYALLNLMASYEFNKHTSATLNINNVTDEKYLNSLYWSQAYYGAPRNVQLTMRWKY